MATNSFPLPVAIDYGLICRVARHRAAQKCGIDWRDLAQETAVRGLMGRESVDGPMLDMMWRQRGARAQNPVVLLPLAARLPAQDERPTVILPRLQSAIDALPLRYRRVLHLTYWHDLNRAEIAAQMGVVRSRISQIHTRAIRQIREAIQ